ncbi:hypothetical protein HTZ77_18000 [Nonomuraea sp. SMC257]|uniref:Uncharacterized protein n=1 Tax=Nonomuraea montanisoli TaxID=2741721 RepID=A0A7Y6I7V8_9ACTN|nr:DUF6463 family protein [Nonomuraea montanisoli]NUW33307.1 hypothetical protein [Nonomuraea montanisoli]
MNSRKRLLRWASGIMIALGVGHLVILTTIDWRHVSGWADRGMWAAVPLDLSGSAVRTAESLQNTVTFWAGLGSFAVPLALLGGLIWRLAGRGVAVPAWVGWGLAVWCVFGGVLLVPSPYFVGTLAGLLVVFAARKTERGPAPS